MSHLCFQIIQPSSKDFLMPSASFILGRGEDAHIHIDDPHCSKKHCRITLLPQGLLIEDLQSKNGTFLNGLKIQRGQFYIEDTIRIGDTVIKILPEKCSTDLLDRLTFKGDSKDRAANALKLGGNTKLQRNNMKESPSNHDENITSLRQNPLFKDAALKGDISKKKS